MEYMNVVRMRIKDGCHDEFMAIMEDEMARQLADGQVAVFMVETGDSDICYVGRWESEQALAAARPTMIATLDRTRHLLETLSAELGVTDPVSGPVLMKSER